MSKSGLLRSTALPLLAITLCGLGKPHRRPQAETPMPSEAVQLRPSAVGAVDGLATDRHRPGKARGCRVHGRRLKSGKYQGGFNPLERAPPGSEYAPAHRLAS